MQNPSETKLCFRIFSDYFQFFWFYRQSIETALDFFWRALDINVFVRGPMVLNIYCFHSCSWYVLMNYRNPPSPSALLREEKRFLFKFVFKVNYFPAMLIPSFKGIHLPLYVQRDTGDIMKKIPSATCALGNR